MVLDGGWEGDDWVLNSSLGLDLFLRLTATDRMTGIVKEAENVKKKKPKKKKSAGK